MINELNFGIFAREPADKTIPDKSYLENKIQKYFTEDIPEQNRLVEMSVVDYEVTENKAACVISFYHPRLGEERTQYFSEEKVLKCMSPRDLVDAMFNDILSSYWKYNNELNYTRDLSLLNAEELAQVAELLTKFTEYRKSHSFPIRISLKPQYNIFRGVAFLIEDEDSEEQQFRAWGINSKGEVDEWICCSWCGKEGFRSEFEPDPECEGCQDLMENLQ